jgi:hypothetical protein
MPTALIPTTLLVAVLMISSGCAPELRTEYGYSRGVEGDQSVNGFGALRRTFKNRGWSTRDVNRLNERMATVDTLVWIPNDRDTLYKNAMDWLEDWLSKEKRTLVYLVPDDGCEAEYFEAARTLTDPMQRLEYRRRLARLETDQLLERLRQGSIPGNGWFSLEYLPEGVSLEGVSGQWLSTDPSEFGRDMTSTSPRGPNADYRIIPPSTSVSTASSGSPSFYGMSQGTSTAEMERETLLAASDGSVLVTRITATQWGQSKILVVSSGSLLSNYSLATPTGQAMAAKLVQETRDAPGTVAFMSTDFRGALVSDVDPEINATTGMELFTVWPLSLVMLHLAVMGFIACMVLVPIFGRPREGKRDSTSDFGDHLDAVATLMYRSGGEDFARRRVSDYMRRIRGEVVGEWLLPETKASDQVIAMPAPSLAISGARRNNQGSSSFVSAPMPSATATPTPSTTQPSTLTPTTIPAVSPADLSTSNEKETP